MITTNPYKYITEPVHIGKEGNAITGFAHLPLDVQRIIFAYLTARDLHPRVCRKFAAVWLNKALEEVEATSHLAKNKYHTEELKKVVEYFFAALKKLPKNVLFPEKSMPTIPLIRGCFTRLGSQMANFSFKPLTAAIEECSKQGDAEKFIRNIPSALIKGFDSVAAKELTERLECGERLFSSALQAIMLKS
jgi:hypothetical protein